MNKLSTVVSVIAAVVLVAGACPSPAFAAGKSKIIEMPSKKPAKPKCVEQPPRLDGNFTQVLHYNVGGLKESYTTTGRLTWKKQIDTLPPLPMAKPAAEGLPGSKAYRDFHAKARCPVAQYAIDSGELTVETVSNADTQLATCNGTGTTSYDAVAVLAPTSNLYVADNGYLLTIGAPDTRMGVNTVQGECISKFDGTRFAFEPIAKQTSPNIIWILDRQGPVRYGVHGKINPAISAPGHKMLTAKWDFADPAPNR